MDIANLIAVIGALGGLEFFRWWFTRRSQMRQKEIETATGELHYFQEVADFYKQECEQLRGMVDKLESERDDSKSRLRSTQDNLLNSERALNKANERLISREKKIGEMELTIQYLLNLRCHKTECVDREPPNDKLKNLKIDYQRINRYIKDDKTKSITAKTKTT